MIPFDKKVLGKKLNSSVLRRIVHFVTFPIEIIEILIERKVFFLNFSKNKNNHHLKHGQTPFYDFVTQNRDQNQRNLIKTSTSSTLLPSSPLKTNTSDNNKGILQQERFFSLAHVSVPNDRSFLSFLHVGGQNANDHDDGRLLTSLVVRRDPYSLF